MRHARLWLFCLILIAAFAGADPASGYSNGRLPDSALSPAATGASCNQLAADGAAASFNSAALAAGHNLGLNGCISAYRSYSEQVYIAAHCPLLCATPGTSNHGLGHAIDANGTTVAFLRAHPEFRWAKTEAFNEWWHYNFIGGWHRPDPGVNLHSPELARGSGGPGQAPYVRLLQHLLRRAGAKQLTVDGDLGRRTCGAIKSFRRARGFRAECKVGPNLWKQLRGPVTRAHHRDSGKLEVSGPVSGVDVSEHQGSINWDDVSKDGIEFACVKATEGEDFTDAYFNRARLEAIDAEGMVPCAYHFLRPRPGRTGAVEATFFAQTLQAAGYGVGDLRPVLDVEVTELGAGTCAYVRSAADRLEQIFGAKPIIYTGPYFGTTYLSGCGLGDYPLWVAHYGVSKPSLPAPWSGYAIWQHSDSAHVDGIAGAVDHDLVPGGREALDALRLKAPEGHGGDPDDGTRDPVDGQHRHRPPCSSRAHPHRCRLHRRCERGHQRACRRERRLEHGDRHRHHSAPRVVSE